MKIGSLLVLVWLVIGVLAAFQRGYFDDEVNGCNKAASIAATIAVGPLNYAGVNPKINCDAVNVDVKVPKPSK
ncbi:MAG: hypothetical protein LC789_11555 [Actinobacteria bacterium]|nr:hypothetical protein [Actinomycetota bacterium]MCA1719802.1 hypothetical protein [Actinomycetota bacterium]